MHDGWLPPSIKLKHESRYHSTRKKARAKEAAGYIKKKTQDGERNRVGGRRVRNVRRREKRIEAIKETIMMYIKVKEETEK